MHSQLHTANPRKPFIGTKFSLAVRVRASFLHRATWSYHSQHDIGDAGAVARARPHQKVRAKVMGSYYLYRKKHGRDNTAIQRSRQTCFFGNSTRTNQVVGGLYMLYWAPPCRNISLDERPTRANTEPNSMRLPLIRLCCDCKPAGEALNWITGHRWF